MRLHRFYITQEIVPGKQLTIDSAEFANQIRRVFRLKSGDKIIIFNGNGFDYTVNIANFSDHDRIANDNRIIVDVDTSAPTRSNFIAQRKIYLYVSVIKKDNFEWVTQKATELGVTDIIPVLAERSEKKNLNIKRLEKIIVEACEQSGRGDIPRLYSVVDLPRGLPSGSRSIAFHTEGKRFEPGSVPQNEDVSIFIGPEGGWSSEELDMFHNNNIQVLRLGNQVLRTETAVISALSLLVFS